jgi:DNA mismatch endonuclease (patch repair protein)
MKENWLYSEQIRNPFKAHFTSLFMDKFTKNQRSYCMSRIKSRGTKPELLLKKKLKGFIYQPRVFGSPDFINYKKKEAVFIDGCFWHGCPHHFRAPASNRKYWLPKIKRNMRRDREINLAYKFAGWKVRRIWEHSKSKTI